ncbi:RNA polymerase sporulation sigma factor SigF [Alicyclobacillus shizuokensis]|uniref:RNA polymerase sporulation sigma factor SigF n=1 Tax=Alicyclobacillus shizuokensis TaxID=392014 RepID=UPI00082E3E1F|nr:RNA polymerase sporulation sigma factor SigF [Alicyclobacillus shizuokensis]MCL6625534.1 RNA polymerase sporulation sigma factor SigF [Alicyclobacillus shizuokensis]
MDYVNDTEERSRRYSDEEIRALIARSQQGDVAARDELVIGNQRLVWAVVQRFLGRGYEADDLFQIGVIGLMKAIDKFDLSYDVKFSTYAVPMIIGEIQRFLRDDSTVKVSRSLKETARHIRRARDELAKRLGRQPQITEIADELGIDPSEVVFAQEALRAPTSIHETVFENDGDPIYLMDQIADEESVSWLDHIALHEVLGRLPERERLIVYLRFFKDKTQSDVAAVLGISQVQVSRLEKKILRSIRQQLES